jgi:hypothetical protein
MRKVIIIAIVILCPAAILRAQNEVQALRYSMISPFGTARYAAQGGAIGALGGDFSSVQSNPAGLAFYRASEFSFTPSFYWVDTRSEFLNSVTEDSNLKFTVGSLGYVTAKSGRQKNGPVGAAFAFGYNTLANFNNHTTMLGMNRESSLLDNFTWHANSEPDNLNPFYEQVAYDAYLLPYDSIAGEYWNDIQNGGYGQQQSRYIERWGYIGEYNISGAINVSNLVYLGATFGIHSVRFYEDIYHSESDPTDAIAYFNSFDFNEFNSTTGWGYTFRFGMIIRPMQLFRVGASVQVPTFYHLTEQKYTNASSTWDRSSGIPDGSAYSPDGVYDYTLRTPMRVNAHASVILGKAATISAAYEYVDYTRARLDAYSDKFIEENNNIRSSYQAVHCLSAGGEVRISALYLRTGMQYLRSPYRDPRNNAEQWIISGGIGFRTKHAFFDTSYSRGNRNEVYGLYDPGNGAQESSYISNLKINPNNLLFTVGLKF